MQKEVLNIGKNGLVMLPLWAWKLLVKKSGIRSKRYRIQKKAVKREFTKLLREALKGS
jgi:hypothetical protein